MPVPWRSLAAALATLPLLSGACGGANPGHATAEGWQLTVYYTLVETFHNEPYESISDCSGALLGSHPSDFLKNIQTEGFGRLAGPIGGFSYLGWDFDRRCWSLARAPIGARDQPLRPWGSAAAGPSTPLGTHVKVSACGGPIDKQACERVKVSAWTVDDRFSGTGGNSKHLDLYVGEEDRANFESTSLYYFDARGATVSLG